jgi:hypothetical protein
VDTTRVKPPGRIMRALATATIATLAAGLCASAAHADDRIACAPDTYLEARSLASLPDGVHATLVHAPHKPQEISDRGGPFNAGDFGGGPFRRFALAAIGLNQLVVAVEDGGIAYWVEVWRFQRGATGWVGQQDRSVSTVPTSAKNLIGLVCK